MYRTMIQKTPGYVRALLACIGIVGVFIFVNTVGPRTTSSSDSAAPFEENGLVNNPILNSAANNESFPSAPEFVEAQKLLAFEECYDKLVIAQGFGGKALIQVRNFDTRWGAVTSILRSFSGAGGSFLEKIGGGSDRTVHLSAGDLNQDESCEIVVTLGPLRDNAMYPNIVIARNAETMDVLGHSFVAFPTGDGALVNYNGGEVRTAVGDFIGSGQNQIAAAQGYGGNGIIRLFQYTGKPAPNGWQVVGQFNGLPPENVIQPVTIDLIDGIRKYFPTQLIRSTVNIGLTLAAGDLDRDGVDELVVGQGNGPRSETLFHVLDIGRTGKIEARHAYTGFTSKFRGIGGIELAVADLNGDGWQEIIVSSKGNPKTFNDPRDQVPLNLVGIIQPIVEKNQVTGFKRPGGINVFNVFSDLANPSGAVAVAAGEFNGHPNDGQELVFGTGCIERIDGFNIIPEKSAPMARYRLLKVHFDGTNVTKIEALPGPPQGYTAFAEMMNPSSGGISLAVIPGDCYYPVDPNPSIPDQEVCVEAGDYFLTPKYNLPSVNLGSVEMYRAILPDGNPANLSVIDCSGDNRLDVYIPWSESMEFGLFNPQSAKIRFLPRVCGGHAPQTVRVTLKNSNQCALFAYDDLNNFVDMETAAATERIQTITLSSASGIRWIRVEGADICITRICWVCSDSTLRPTPTIATTPTDTPTPTITPTPTAYIPPQLGWIPFRPDAKEKDKPRTYMKEESTSGILVNFDVPGMFAHEVEYEGVVYHRLTIPNYYPRGEIGKPDVPVLGQALEIPAGVSFSVEIYKASSMQLSNYNVVPAQVPDIEAVDNKEGVFQIDDITYNTDAFYPGKSLLANVEPGDDGIIRGHRVIFLKVNPIQYNPVSKTIEAYSNIEVRVKFKTPAQRQQIHQRLRSDDFENLLSNLLLNYKDPKQYANPAVKKTARTAGAISPSQQDITGCDYLILTHGNFYVPSDPTTPLELLSNWKRQKGLLTRIVDISAIPGGTTAADIQSYIQTAYDTWYPAPSCVLLVGDSDFIPPHYVTVHTSAGHAGTRTGTDLYYATVDGADYFPDIMIGRLSVDSLPETRSFVDKIIAYETNPPANANYYNDTSLVRLFEDDSPANGREDDVWILIELAEELRDFLIGKGYTADRIYNQSGVIPPGPLQWNDGTALPDYLTVAGNPPTVPGFPWNGNTADITNAFNNGQFLITYRGHGARAGWSWPTMQVANMPALTNANSYPVLFGLTCQAGWFDNETDDAVLATNAGNDCFSEEVTTLNNAGAAAVLACTRNSWGSMNNPATQGMCDALWPDFDNTIEGGYLPKMGQISTYCRSFAATRVTHSTSRLLSFEMYTLFGDPDMAVWIEEPGNLDVQFPAGIGSTGMQDFVVTVADKNTFSPVASAVVVLTFNHNIVAVRETNPAGIARFMLGSPSSGRLTLTVTHYKYRPFIDEIAVSAGGAALNRLDPSDGTEGSSFLLGGTGFQGSENIRVYFGDTLLDTVTASGGQFGQLGISNVSLHVPSPYAFGPINILAQGQTSGRYAVDVYTVRGVNPIDLYTYDQWDDTTWHLHPGDNPTWNNPEIQLYDKNGIAVESNNLVVGETYSIKAEVHNDTDFNAQNVECTFKWADFGLAQPDKVWTTIGTDKIDVNAHSTGSAEISWTPPHTGHLCILFEIYHIEDINENNNKGQENCHIGPTSSPAKVDFLVWNPTEEPAAIHFEVRQLSSSTSQNLIWATEIEHPDPQVIMPGETGKAIIVINPDFLDIPKGSRAEFSVTAYLNRKIHGGANFIIVKMQ